MGNIYNNREKGSRGEKLAINYLVNHGYDIIETNYTTKIGEIDIVAKDKGVYSFIEVKYRENTRTGRPVEAVNYYKQKKIIRVAMLYAQKHTLFEKNIRFDVIEIVKDSVHLIKNAFVVENNYKLL